MAKPYSKTYLYGKYGDYDKKIYEFIISAERIDTKSSEFDDILYEYVYLITKFKKQCEIKQ